MKSYVISVVLLLALLASNTSQAWAPSLLPDYAIRVSDKALSVAITLTLSQNITAFMTSFSLPEIHIMVEGSNSSGAVDAVQNALQARSPRARVSNLTLGVESSSWSSTTNLQWFNVSLSMDISGIPLVQSGVAQIDLSWKSFVVSSPISIAGVEVNNIGASLLLKVAQDLAGLTSSGSRVQFFYFVRDNEVGRSFFPTAVRGLSTLDFSGFAAPLSEWHTRYVPLAETNTWTLEPKTSWGMRVVQQIQEVAPQRIAYGIWSTASGKITAPSGFSVEGDTIKLFLDSFPETLMVTVILSVGLIGLGTAVYERRILKGSVRKRARR